MAVSVGQVFAEFVIKGIDQATTAMTNIAKQLDAVNKRSYKLTIDYSSLTEALKTANALGTTLGKISGQTARTSTSGGAAGGVLGGGTTVAQSQKDAIALADFVIRQQGRVDQAITAAANKRMAIAQQNVKTDMAAEQEIAANKARLLKQTQDAQIAAADAQLKREAQQAQIIQQLDKQTAKEKSDLLKQRQKDTANAMRDEEERARKLAQAEREAAEAAKRNFQTIQTAVAAPYQAALRLSQEIKNIGETFTHLGQVMSIFGYRATMVAAPLIAAAGVGAKSAIEVEQSVRLVATQLDNLKPDAVDAFVKGMTQSLGELSTRFPKDANDLAKAMYFLVSTLTIKPEVAASFIEPIAKLATATNSTALEITTAITPVLNVWKNFAQTSEGVNHVLEVLFETIKRGKGEPADIARQLGDFAEQMSIAGATFEESMALFAQATRLAGSPAEASTWVSQLATAMTSDKTVRNLKDMGIEVTKAVEGTGEWVYQSTELDKKQQSAYTGIVNKLSGETGVTGLYKQLALQQRELVAAQQEYDKKATISSTKRLDTAKFNVANTQQQIDYYQKEKGALDEVAGAQQRVFTGEMVRRDFVDILDDIIGKILSIKDQQKQLEAIHELFPNVRGTRGFLSFLAGQEDVKAWADKMSGNLNQVGGAANIMLDSVQSKLQILQNTFETTARNFFQDFIEPRLKPILDTITKIVAAFDKASPSVKEFAFQLGLIIIAAGPLAFALGTLFIGLGGIFSIVGSLLSPFGLGGLLLLVNTFGPVFDSFQKAVEAAGGGLDGLAAVIAGLAVKLGLIKESDANAFLEQMGVKFRIGAESGAAFNRSLDEMASAIRDVVTTVREIVTAIQQVVTFITDHKEVLEGAVFVIAASKLGTLILALIGPSGLAAAFGGATAAAGPLMGALNLLAAHPLIALALAGVATVVLIKVAIDQGAFDDTVKKLGFIWTLLPGGSPDMANNPFAPKPNIGPYAPLSPTYGPQRPIPYAPSGASLPPGGYGQYDPFHLTPPGGTPTPSWLQDETTGNLYPNPALPTWMQDEMRGNTAGATGTTPAAKVGGPIPTRTVGGAGGIPVTRLPPTGQDVLSRLGGRQWVSDFASQHGGQDPFSFYQGQGYADPAAAALRDKAWGDQFFAEHGKAAEQGDWETHWYQTYQKNQTDELDAEGKPTGKKKTEISGPVDAFTKMVQDAFKGLTDKKEELTKAYTDPAQSLLDKKEEITKAYTDPVEKFQGMVEGVITTIDNLRARLANYAGAPPPVNSSGTGGEPGKPFHSGTVTPVPYTGLYQLLKGEQVVSVPEITIGRSVTNNNQRGGDVYHLNINAPAGTDTREVADFVMQRLKFEQFRRGL